MVASRKGVRTVRTGGVRRRQSGQGRPHPSWVWPEHPLGMVVSAGATHRFAVRKCLVKGLKEKFNAVSFYLPLQLMSTEQAGLLKRTSVFQIHKIK